jgi:hypothetical protein
VSPTGGEPVRFKLLDPIVVPSEKTAMTKLLSTLLFAATAAVAFNAQAASHVAAAPMAKASEAKHDAKKMEEKKEAKPAAKAASK